MRGETLKFREQDIYCQYMFGVLFADYHLGRRNTSK